MQSLLDQCFITETVKETGIGSHQLTHAGNVHLDGIQAVAYGRIRYSDTDYARTERQRIILQKAFDKAKNCRLGDTQLSDSDDHAAACNQC